MRNQIETAFYKPVSALVTYKYDAQHYSHSAYTTYHDIIEKEDGSFDFGKPKPITEKFVKDLFASYNQQKSNASFLIPENLLIYNKNKIAWYHPHRYVNFLLEDEDVVIDMGNLRLLFIKDMAGSLYVKLVKCGINRPKENSEILKLIAFNIDNEGNVCLGNTRVKDDSDNPNEIIQAYTTAFLLSRFTEEERMKGVKDYWKQILKKKKLLITKSMQYNKKICLKDLII